jgi:hypothetical protein
LNLNLFRDPDKLPGSATLEKNVKLGFIYFLLINRGVNAIVYMVDAADSDKIEAARNELHNLLEKPQLAGIPVLVLGNEILYTDLQGFGSIFI